MPETIMVSFKFQLGKATLLLLAAALTGCASSSKTPNDIEFDGHYRTENDGWPTFCHNDTETGELVCHHLNDFDKRVLGEQLCRATGKES